MVKLAALAAIIVVAAAGCQSHDDQKPPARKDARAVEPMPPPIDASEEPVREPEPPDPGKVLADLGAVSAWQAVIDRAHYLARRGQHGVVYGTLGPPIFVLGPTPPPAPDGGPPIDAGLVPSPYTWLVDDTDGNGSLAIRVVLGTNASKVKQGDRVALGGAWQLDEARRWYWKVDALTPLLPAPPSDLKEPPSPPGHEIQSGPVPPGAVPVSQAKDNDLITFQVTGPKQPVMPGEGWPVADRTGNPTFALLNLPGEWPSYGGQDFRTPDERWQLERGKTYWVRIGKIRRPSADQPALINARTAPVRVK
jgi:hypothetical protein